MPNITITGYVYHSDGSIASGERLIIKKLIKNNVLISNNPIIVKANENGYIQFTTLDDSYLWLYSKDIVGYDEYEQGTPVYTTTASVQNLSTLASFTGLLPSAIPVITNSNNHDHDKYATTATVDNHVTDNSIHFTTGSISALWGSGSNAGLTGDVNQIAVFSSTSTATGNQSFTYDSHSTIEVNPPTTGTYNGYGPNADISNYITYTDNDQVGNLVIGQSITSSPFMSVLIGQKLLNSYPRYSLFVGYDAKISYSEQVIAALRFSKIDESFRSIIVGNSIGNDGTDTSRLQIWDSIVAGSYIISRRTSSRDYVDLLASIVNGYNIYIKYLTEFSFISGSTITSDYVYNSTVQGYGHSVKNVGYGVIFGNSVSATNADYTFVFSDAPITVNEQRTFIVNTTNGSKFLGGALTATRIYVGTTAHSNAYELTTKAYVDSLTGNSSNAGLTGINGQLAIFSNSANAIGYTGLTSNGNNLFVSGSVISSTTAVTSDNQLITKAYLDSITANLGGGMNLKYITLTGSTTGDIHLSDATNWNINKANINYIRVDTSSSAWNMYLLQNDNGYAVNDAVIPALQIMNNGFQNQVLYLDHNYWDEDSSNEVHLYWNSLSGSITASIYVVGTELK